MKFFPKSKSLFREINFVLISNKIEEEREVLKSNILILKIIFLEISDSSP